MVEAPDGFDARFSALWRRYAYRIADRPEAVDPLRRGHVLAWPRPLDVAAMNAAALALLGEHDFAAFCKQREGATTIRTLLDLRWERDAGRAAGRRTCGPTRSATAWCARWSAACSPSARAGARSTGPAEVLAAGARDSAVAVAAAHGLTLEEVGYPPDDELAARVEITQGAAWLRTSTTSPPTRRCRSGGCR